MSDKNLYEVLGVAPDADEKTIKSAYKKLIKETHPDLASAGNRKVAEEKSKLVNEAKHVLLDKERRAQYDLSRRTPQNSGRAPGYDSGGMDFGNFDFGGGGYRRVTVTDNFGGGLSGDIFEQLLQNLFGGNLGDDDFFNRFASVRPAPRPTLMGELYVIQLPLSNVNMGIDYLNKMFEYYGIQLLQHEGQEGTKYYTLWCLLRGSEKNLEKFKETLKKKNIKIVKKKVANS